MPATAEIIPPTEPLTLTHRRGSMGSHYIAFHADSETVLALARLRLEDVFRRVVLDPARGLVWLMAPGRTHEGLSSRIDFVIQEIATRLNLDCEPLRATRWRRPTDPPDTGAEPDCCYYLGENALAYQSFDDDESEQADAWALAHPPDLVVEVEVTHYDKAKQTFYQELGVSEYWQLEQAPNRKLSAVFLALQETPGPTPLAASRLLPGLTPAALSASVQAMKKCAFRKRREMLLRVLREHGVAVSSATLSAPAPS